MDEFPWMATRNSKLLQSLEYYWNQHWSQDDRIKLIICGSSSGWILKNIVNNRGGLYNRVTHTIKLLPFSLYSTKKLVAQLKIKLNLKQITQLYAVLGGIPFYLTKLTPGLSATQMIDEYSLFYFRWIEPIKKSLLTNGMRKGYWESLQTTPAWQTWSGYAFELICYKHISQISKALGLSPSAVPYSWRYAPTKKHSEERGAEIDLLFDRQDDSITLCEIKYTKKPFIITKEYASNLINKKNTFTKQTRTKKQIFFALISANGMQDNLYADDLIDNQIDIKEYLYIYSR